MNKNLSTEPDGIGIGNKLDIIMSENHIAACIYYHLIINEELLISKKEKSEEVLSIEPSLKQLMQYHKRIWIITNHSKLRFFQNRLVQYVVVTNRRLWQYKRGENQLCHFCEKEAESILHLFCRCEIIKTFYNRVIQYINELVPFDEIEKILTDVDIIFNVIQENPHRISNFIFLVAKYFAYKMRCASKFTLEIIHFKAEIEHMRNMERYYATQNNKIGKHMNTNETSVENPNYLSDYLVEMNL